MLSNMQHYEKYKSFGYMLPGPMNGSRATLHNPFEDREYQDLLGYSGTSETMRSILVNSRRMGDNVYGPPRQHGGQDGEQKSTTYADKCYELWEERLTCFKNTKKQFPRFLWGSESATHSLLELHYDDVLSLCDAIDKLRSEPRNQECKVPEEDGPIDAALADFGWITRHRNYELYADFDYTLVDEHGGMTLLLPFAAPRFEILLTGSGTPDWVEKTIEVHKQWAKEPADKQRERAEFVKNGVAALKKKREEEKEAARARDKST